MLPGKADLLDACRHRRMKVAETPTNLLETRIRGEGVLDGMDLHMDVNCITGLPGDSRGTITFRGNLAQLLSVLERVWPSAPEVRELLSPGRQSWPDAQRRDKEPEA